MESDLPKFSKKKLTPLVAGEKIRSWCAYQERSQQETRDKLYEFGLGKEDVERIVTDLIEAGFLNEERFAEAFARGKFRIKKWGKVRIKMELKQHKVSDYCIKKALQQIDGDEYLRTLEHVIEQRFSREKEINPIKKHYKVLQYAASRGFEKDLAADILKEMEK
ncbi:MAG: regulatory protein RecX [Bacteroidia bacterium]